MPAVNISNALSMLRFDALVRLEYAMRQKFAPDVSDHDAKMGYHEHDIPPLKNADIEGMCDICDQLDTYAKEFYLGAFHVIFGVEYARMRLFSDYTAQYSAQVAEEIREFLTERFGDDDMPTPGPEELTSRRGAELDFSTRYARAQLRKVARTMLAYGITLHFPFDREFNRPCRRGNHPILTWPSTEPVTTKSVFQEVLRIEQINASKYI